LRGRLGAFEPAGVGTELVVPREIIARIEPRNLASPEDVKPGLDRPRIVQGHDREVDRLGLVVDPNLQRGAAVRAKGALAEAR